MEQPKSDADPSGSVPPDDLAVRLNALERAINEENLERKKALIWQEHRLVSAIKTVVENWRKPGLMGPSLGSLAICLLASTGRSAAIGGGLLTVILGLLLALQANYLLEKQNERMDIQTVVMEAQRRAQLFSAEYNAIFNQIDIERGSLQTRSAQTLDQLAQDIAERHNLASVDRIALAEELGRIRFYPQSAALTARIAALTRTLQPAPRLHMNEGLGAGSSRTRTQTQESWSASIVKMVRSLQGVGSASPIGLTDSDKSAERGQFLIALSSVQADLIGVYKAGAVFRRADLRRLRITNLTLAGADMLGSRFDFAQLQNVSTRSTLTQTATNLRESFFSCVVMRGGDLRSADLEGAEMGLVFFRDDDPSIVDLEFLESVDLSELGSIAGLRIAPEWSLDRKFDGDTPIRVLPKEKIPDDATLDDLLRAARIQRRYDDQGFPARQKVYWTEHRGVPVLAFRRSTGDASYADTCGESSDAWGPD